MYDLIERLPDGREHVIETDLTLAEVLEAFTPNNITWAGVIRQHEPLEGDADGE